MPLYANMHQLPAAIEEFGDAETANIAGYHLGVAFMVIGMTNLNDEKALAEGYRRARLWENAFDGFMLVNGEPYKFTETPERWRLFKGFQTNCTYMTPAQFYKHFRECWEREVRL